MTKEERDLQTAELNELIVELERSVAIYTPRNPSFCFAIPLPKALRLLAQAIAELQANSPLPSTLTKADSPVLGHPGEKGSGVID